MDLGLDIGTSGVKAVVVDEQDRVLASATVPLTVQRPAPLAAEQNADDWITAAEAAIAELHRQQPGLLSGIAGIGIAGHMHALLLVGADDRPLAPAMLWNDGRAGAEAALLQGLGPAAAARMGVPAMAGFTAAKLLWLGKHNPALPGRARLLLQPKDYVRRWLTGDAVTDVSDAAGTWLLDQQSRRWDEEAVHATGIDPAILPALVEATEPVGVLRPGPAARLGLPAGITVVAGGGDTPVGGVGIGAVEEGRGFCNLGTSAQLFVAAAAHRPAPASLVHAFCHALPGRWLQMAAMLNGASVLAFAASLTGATDAAALDRAVAAAFRGPGRLLALPYLAGERTPHDDPAASGALIGLRPDTAGTEVALAFMEAVAFSFADAAAALRAAGTGLDELSLIGGGARSLLWPRLLASVLERPLQLHAGAETGPALGAARLARFGRGGGGLPLAARPPVSSEVLPEPALTEAYAPRLAAYRALYGALRPFSAAVAGG